MSIVVLGTDTGVGKTIVSTVVLARYASRLRLAYWKPIQTGPAEESDSRFVSGVLVGLAEVLDEVYRFDAPASPHLAARLAGEEILPERVVESLVAHGLADRRRSLVIEGVGGLLVPLTERGYLLADLVAELHLPCLLVARSTLGTINHTLLTLEAMRTRGMAVAGVVLCGPKDRDNRAAIERFGAVDVLDELPPIGATGSVSEASPRSAAEARFPGCRRDSASWREELLRIARGFDRQARLEEYLA